MSSGSSPAVLASLMAPPQNFTAPVLSAAIDTAPVRSTSNPGLGVEANIAAGHTGIAAATDSNLAIAGDWSPHTGAADAAGAAGAGNGAASGTSATSGNLHINLEFVAADNPTASFESAIETAASMLDAAIYDNITVNLTVGYGEVDGESLTNGEAAAGADLTGGGQLESYSSVRAALIANATAGDTIFNALPTGSSINGQSQVEVFTSQEKLFGQLSANGTEIDGGAGFATDISQSSLVGVALHELTHALGRVPYSPQPDIFDFYRFSSPGTRLFSESIPSAPAYFSLDGGNTKLADYGQNSDPSDFANSNAGTPLSNLTPNDPFDQYYETTTLQSLTTVDLEQLDALGFNTLAPQTVTLIQTDTSSYGSTSLTQVGNNFFFYAAGGSSGPEFKFGGSPVVAGAYGPWAPIGAVKTASGYDIAWAGSGAYAGEYIVWTTDNNGNFVSSVANAVAGNSAVLESYEPIFNQDLNGDGTIGSTATTIHTDTSAYGSTSLTQVGSNFFFYAAGGSSGPEFEFGGSPVVAGAYGPWAPIGAVKTASGYDIAWAGSGAYAGEYIIWTTDNNGNFVASVANAVAGNSAVLKSYEQIFNQDLNGDGTIGSTATTIHTDTSAYGSTSLTQVGSNFFFYAAGGSSGPEFEFGGSPVVAGAYGPWAPIGAVKTASGYDIAWEGSGAYTGEYIIWTTDNNGNFVSSVANAVAGNSAVLESYELIFNQDLNGDGMIGPIGTTIHTDTSAYGSTSLTQVGSNFFFYAAGGSSGPEFEFGGSPVVAGEYGPWAPIGAVKTASGYDIAWEGSGAYTGEYIIWTTDNNGNFVSSVANAVAGNSTVLESYELIFNQDLNGDGTIGPPVSNSFSLQYKGFDYVAFYNGAYENSELAAKPQADRRQFDRNDARLRHRRANLAGRRRCELHRQPDRARQHDCAGGEPWPFRHGQAADRFSQSERKRAL